MRAMNRSDSTSLSLLERARTNEADAWDRLVELYAPLVHHWCRQSNLSGEDVADVLQDVFQSVSQSLASFRRDRKDGTFRGWLRTITQNKIRDLFRKKRQQPLALGGSNAQGMLQTVPDPVALDESTEVSLVHQQLQRALEWIRGELEERTWLAFRDVQYDNKSPGDVAEELGMTPAAVRKARYRVLNRLKEELDGLYP